MADLENPLEDAVAGTETPADSSEAVDPVNRNIVTVAGELEGLLSSDSPYIKRAQTGAKEVAASRGLLNTTMAAQAGEAAAIDAALPIASQDASAENQLLLSDVEAQHTKDILETERKQTEILMAQEAQYATDLSTLEAEQKQAFYDTQNDFEAQLAQMEYTSDEVKAIGSSVTLLGQTLSEQVATIQTDTNLDAAAKTDIIAQLNTMYKSQLDSVAAIYGVPIEWA